MCIRVIDSAGWIQTRLSNPRTKKEKNRFLLQLNSVTYVLPTHSISNNPKFIVISPSDDDKPLSSFSVFLLKKAIDNISTSYEYITQLRDGNLLILVKSQKIADLFLSRKTLSNLCPISVSLHTNLNSSKGTVYAPCLINVPETEIVDEMKTQGVTGVFKFKNTVEGNQRASGLILLTFDLFRPLSSVNIGWYNVKVEEYFPNPMRYRNCQLLGHTANRCKNDPTCETCNLPPHVPNKCTRISCANCSEEHPSSSKICKRYLQAKETLKIKTVRKCSMAEAKQVYGEQNPITASAFTYSAAAKNPTQMVQTAIPTLDVQNLLTSSNSAHSVKIQQIKILTPT